MKKWVNPKVESIKVKETAYRGNAWRYWTACEDWNGRGGECEYYIDSYIDHSGEKCPICGGSLVLYDKMFEEPMPGMS